MQTMTETMTATQPPLMNSSACTSRQHTITCTMPDWMPRALVDRCGGSVKATVTFSDAERAVGVAGVMGGYDSEVTAKTTSVVFEAAVFNGPSIRRTSKALGMRSEASGRFERGVNHKYTAYAIDRAAE